MSQTPQRHNQRQSEQRNAPPAGGPERLQRHSRSTDRFEIDRERIPQGQSYEWKRLTALGQEDKQHQVHLARNHWTPVPSERHPEIAGAGAGKEPIVVDGLILMERPAYLTEEARAEDNDNAIKQIRDQMVRLGQAPAGTGPRDVDPRTRPQVTRTFERVEIPDDE